MPNIPMDRKIAGKSISDIAVIISFHKIDNPILDKKFIQLLEVDKRILEREDVFRDLAISFFGPSFGKYLTGYVFDV